MIKIIEKNTFITEDGTIHPIMMIKDNKEIHIINKNTINNSEIERIINIIKISDGRYTVMYGAYDNPFDLLQDIAENKQLIRKDLKEEIFDVSESDGDFTDFIGSTSPLYSIFNYRIYDNELLQDIKEIVALINNKEWDIAKVEIEAKRKKYNEIAENIKDKLLGLEFNMFYQLIDKQLEIVKENTNYRIFKKDIEILKDVNTGTGLASITANNWLKHICNLTEVELKKYVDNYKQGLLNLYFYEGQDQSSEEIENDEIEQ